MQTRSQTNRQQLVVDRRYQVKKMTRPGPRGGVVVTGYAVIDTFTTVCMAQADTAAKARRARDRLNRNHR
jgi:hypothetical protein